eukprot:m51a1_g11898 hypothetical protein (194) ;mRNA; f:608935-609705
MDENAPANALHHLTKRFKVVSLESTSMDDDTENAAAAAGAVRKQRRGRKAVQFADQVAEVHEYSATDAPSANILDVVASPEHGGAGASAGSPFPHRPQHHSSRAIRVDADVDYRVAFALHHLEGVVRAEFDTETMTLAELRQALESHELSAKGTKSELKERLEDYILEEQGLRTKCSRKKKQRTTEAPEWLSW